MRGAHYYFHKPRLDQRPRLFCVLVHISRRLTLLLHSPPPRTSRGPGTTIPWFSDHDPTPPGGLPVPGPRFRGSQTTTPPPPGVCRSQDHDSVVLRPRTHHPGRLAVPGPRFRGSQTTTPPPRGLAVPGPRFRGSQTTTPPPRGSRGPRTTIPWFSDHDPTPPGPRGPGTTIPWFSDHDPHRVHKTDTES